MYAGTFSTPLFLLIPAIGIWTGYFPIEFNLWFAAAFTMYFTVLHIMVYYCHSFAHIRCAQGASCTAIGKPLNLNMKHWPSTLL